MVVSGQLLYAWLRGRSIYWSWPRCTFFLHVQGNGWRRRLVCCEKFEWQPDHSKVDQYFSVLKAAVYDIVRCLTFLWSLYGRSF